jgi:hypothetical protein
MNGHDVVVAPDAMGGVDAGNDAGHDAGSQEDTGSRDAGTDAKARDAGEDSGKDAGAPTCTGCTATEVCVDGACVPCGGSGDPCCASGPPCTSATLACAAGSCTTCGGTGQPCCAGTTCGSELTCSGGTCQCGNYGEACCGGITCDDANLTCVSGSCTCGAIEQVCCAAGGAVPACKSTGAGGAPATCAPGGECSCLKACDNSEIQRSDNTVWDPSALAALTYDGVHPLLPTGFSGSGNILGCAVDSNGAAWCWGPNNAFGQLGNGTTTTPQPSYQARQVLTAPATPLTGITKIVVDPRQGFTACAIDTNTDLWCWGCPNFDYSTTYLYATKVLTSAGGSAFTGVTDLSVGEFHDCAITSDGNHWCWGANDAGLLGTGDTTGASKTYPVLVSYFQTNTLKVASVAVGSSGFANETGGVTCASTTGGNVYCWGSNESGALEGTISASYVVSPVEMVASSGGAPLTQISSVQIVSGSASPCAVTSTGSVLCWGSMPHLASWPSPYYPSAYQEGGAFPSILKLCGDTGYGNAGTFGTTFLDTNGIYHQGGQAYAGEQAPLAATCGP